MKKRNMTIIGCIFLLFCVAVPSFSSAWPAGYILPDDYYIDLAEEQSGNLYSLKHNDANYLVLYNDEGSTARLYVDFPSNDAYWLSFEWYSSDNDAWVRVSDATYDWYEDIDDQGVNSFTITNERYLVFLVYDLGEEETVSFDYVVLWEDPF